MGADTGQADSVDTDSGPPTATTFGLTVMLGGEKENVAATRATSLSSTSLPSNSLRADERVKWYAIIDKKVNDRSQVQTRLFTYLMKQPRWRRQLKSIVKSTIKYPTINYRQRHTRLIDNSDDYGQLKSIRIVNCSRWKSKSDNDEVRRKSQSTINEESRHSRKGIDNQRPTRIDTVRQSQIDLLTYCRQPQYQQSRWPTIYQATIRNVRQLSAIKNYIPKKQ